MDFLFVSDHIGLDFAATVSWRATHPVELLAEPDDLTRWLTEAGLSPHPDEATRADLELARALREAAYRAAGACATRQPCDPADLALLNGFAARNPMRPVVTAAGAIAWSGGVEQGLSTVARATCRLIGTAAHTRVRACAGHS
ncbi:Putative stress-induced transcription regulator, partial [Streptomyces sp. DvalAA-14]|uniref:CGNR zinc finger domain-containing protein n=1 Tax=unclassified Streptomyces TaxID=2593676 RepID=UPI00081BB644